MLDLSSLMPKRDDDPYYDLMLHQVRNLDIHNLEAHIRSMKHSQRADYKKGLRVVIDAEEFGLTAYSTSHVPLTQVALNVPDEVVFRTNKMPGKEFVVKARDGELGWRDVLSPAPAPNPVAQSIATGKPAGGRAWVFDRDEEG